MKRRIPLFALVAALTGSAGLLSGCNDAQSGALLGAGIGQVIGGDTEATLIGAGVGYIIGNESDKAKHHQQHNDDYDY